MSRIRKTENITKARKNFSDHMEHRGIVPITRNGNFSGVIISVGENDDATARRLHDLIKRNPKAGIETLRQKALNNA